MFLPIKALAKRFQMSKTTCFMILQEANIPAMTASGKRTNGSDGWYDEKQAIPILRKVRRKKHIVKGCYV